MSATNDFDAFAEQAAQLETRIADAEARGEPVPPEARAMLVALRELAQAVAGLRATLASEAGAAEEPPSAG